MALAVADSGKVSRLTAEILRQLHDEEAQAQTLDLIRARVEQYEADYQLDSAEIHEAIRTGRLVETHQVCQWLMDYHVLLRAGEA